MAGAGFMSPTMMSPLLGGVQFSPGPDLNKGSRSPGFAPMSPGYNPQSPGERRLGFVLWRLMRCLWCM